jgi:hypothetical protein
MLIILAAQGSMNFQRLEAALLESICPQGHYQQCQTLSNFKATIPKRV